MFRLFFLVATLTSLNSFAADQCVNLSGTYILKAGDCDAATNSMSGGVKFQEFVGGEENDISLYPDYQVRIDQTDCNSLKITRIKALVDPNDQTKVVDGISTYASAGLTKTLSTDENSVTYHEAYIAGLVNKDETMTLTKNDKGIAVDYLGKLLTMAFVIPMTDQTISRCQLTKAQ